MFHEITRIITVQIEITEIAINLPNLYIFNSLWIHRLLSLILITSCSLFVNRDFDNAELLKQACREFAVKGTFEFTTKKSSKSIYTIICKEEGCPWRLYVFSIEDTSGFRIKTFKSSRAIRRPTPSLFTAWSPSTTRTLVQLCIRIARSIILSLSYLKTTSTSTASS